MKLLMLALAGAVGTLARYGMSTAVQRWAGHGFPWGTFAVNALGCLMFGLLWGLFEARQAALGPWRAVVLVGFLGSFTTFSSFAHDSGALLRGGDLPAALLNIAGQNILGLLALFAGLALARWIP
ncbi:MAG TPA: CrcB family protein [Kiritimatiellia bacterium]|nr:CrcB family protein [Kiritimatiellia bacterium]